MLASGCDVAAAPMNLGQLQCQHKSMPTTSVGIPAASTDCTCWEGGQEQQLSSWGLQLLWQRAQARSPTLDGSQQQLQSSGPNALSVHCSTAHATCTPRLSGGNKVFFFIIF